MANSLSNVSDRSKVEKALAALKSDYTRQGARLLLSDVVRQIDKRSLSDDEAVDLYIRLEEGGIYPVDLAQEPTDTLSDAILTDSDAQNISLDPLDLCFRDALPGRLLTAEEEISLMRQIRAGEVAEMALATTTAEVPPLDILWQLANAGKKARERMILSNVRLALSVAKIYEGRSHLELFDLWQEGILGINRAINTFDHKRGLKFSTYATHWIEQRISRAVDDKGSTIRLPVHVRDLLRKVKRVRRALKWEKGDNEPSIREIAEYLGVKPEKIAALELISKTPVSLDAPPTGREQDFDTIGESIPAPQVDDLDTTIFRKELLRSIFGDHGILPERQQAILKLRFGIDDGHDLTLEEIGQMFNVTRERIRQIETKAIDRLRIVLSREPYCLKSASTTCEEKLSPEVYQKRRKRGIPWKSRKPQRSSSTGSRKG